MKGYVSVTFTDKQKQELFDLYNKINEFNRKPKSEVFGYTTFTVDKKFLWWKWQGEVELWCFKCPEELEEFFAEMSYSEDFYYFYLNNIGEKVQALYNLVKQNSTVLLGTELCLTLNELQGCGYISI